MPVGNKRVLIRPVEAGETCPHKEFEIEDSEVYDVDIAMSTGSGLPRMGEIPTTVFRRDVHRKFNLRMKAARHVYAVVDKQFPTMPFAVRQLGMPKARLGIKECISQEMVFCYDTMYGPYDLFFGFVFCVVGLYIYFFIYIYCNSRTRVSKMERSAPFRVLSSW